MNVRYSKELFFPWRGAMACYSKSLFVTALTFICFLLSVSCSKQSVNSETLLQVEADTISKKAEQPAIVDIAVSEKSSNSSDIAIPSSYQITLSGKTEADTFSSVGAILELRPTEQPDPNPVLVAIYPTETNMDNLAVGHFFWQSYTAELPTADEHYSRLTVDGSQVQMEVNPSDTFRSDVMWFTQVTGTLAEIPGMENQGGRMGATPQSGTMTFQTEDERITGEVTLSGTSDLGTPSTYQATFTGQILQ